MGTASLARVDEPTAVRPLPDFDHLYESYSETVYRTALRVTGNGADADSQRQRHQNSRSETWIPAEGTERKTQILEQTLQERHPHNIPVLFLHLLHSAEPKSCLPAGFLRAHPVTDVVLLLHLQVKPQLVVEVGIKPALAKERGYPGDN